MNTPTTPAAVDAMDQELRGKTVRYHGSVTELHGDEWTVRGRCDLFDECDDDPSNADGECGYEWGPRWALLGRAIGGGRHQLLLHVRRESFTLLADQPAAAAEAQS